MYLFYKHTTTSFTDSRKSRTILFHLKKRAIALHVKKKVPALLPPARSRQSKILAALLPAESLLT